MLNRKFNQHSLDSLLDCIIDREFTQHLLNNWLEISGRELAWYSLERTSTLLRELLDNWLLGLHRTCVHVCVVISPVCCNITAHYFCGYFCLTNHSSELLNYWLLGFHSICVCVVIRHIDTLFLPKVYFSFS